ncbi:MAG: VCBS repeat-containing protein [Planctomycetota bacterium]
MQNLLGLSLSAITATTCLAGPPFSGPLVVVPQDSATFYGMTDINQDGVGDILRLEPAEVSSGTQLVVYESLGDGSFVRWTGLTYPSRPTSDAELHDVNGDGLLDAFVLTPFTDFQSVCGFATSGCLHFARPDRTWGPPIELPDAQYFAWFGHFDDDGFIDAIGDNFINSAPPVLLGNGDGTFRAAPLIEGVAFRELNPTDPLGRPWDPQWADLADFTADGVPDLVLQHVVAWGDGGPEFGDLQESYAQVYEGDGQGGFNPIEPSASLDTVSMIRTIDMDLDGMTDLMHFRENDPGEYDLVYVAGRGDGSFGEPRVFRTGYNGGNAFFPTAQDVDGDSTLDLTTVEPDFRWVEWAPGVPQVGYEPFRRLLPEVDFTRLGVGDVTGDGVSDLVLGSGFARDPVSGTPLPHWGLAVYTGYGPDRICISDLDRDGRATQDDLSIFLSGWLAGQVRAYTDLTTTGGTLLGQTGFGQPDGTVTLDDLAVFVNDWLRGCDDAAAQR